MSTADRRNFLKLLSAGGVGASLNASITRAAALPAAHRTGTIEDVEHVIILMQENRAFDHYFGALRGVRGFGDPRAARLTAETTVFAQPNGASPLYPYRPDVPDLGLEFIADLAHDWTSTHAAWNGGRWDEWVPHKTPTCMVHMQREDIPFHYALADAFTVCDAYYCSVLSSTDPNRYYMWTGSVGNQGLGGGPVVDNAEAGYGWRTYPERLDAAGIDWKVYQDIGLGLTAQGHWGWSGDPFIGNYGDNALLYFNQYRTAPEGSPLAEKARSGTEIAQSGTMFDQFRADVENGRLPQVSWLVAPEAYCEHPNWPPNYGAWYIAQILDILTASPDVWGKTALFLTYDENDGFFDHMIPPTPAVGAVPGGSTVSLEHEFFPGAGSYPAGPYGLGARVPMLVISPWSRGGWVTSEVFDHTSLIRFLERRFGPHAAGLTETNITPWRRAVAGDLTSAFDFKTPNAALTALPDTAAYAPKDRQRHKSVTPAVPVRSSLPAQEPGVRRARALPYALHVHSSRAAETDLVTLAFRNDGRATAVFHVRDVLGREAPRYYTVSPGAWLDGSWVVPDGSRYLLDVHGPNGFYRSFGGAVGKEAAWIGLDTRADPASRRLTLTLTPHGDTSLIVQLADAYAPQATRRVTLAPGASTVLHHETEAQNGWYDLMVTAPGLASRKAAPTVHLAGHLENGAPSTSDPLIGRPPEGSTTAT